MEASAPPVIKFEKVDIGKAFFRKITLHLENIEEIIALAAQCRMKYVTKGNPEAPFEPRIHEGGARAGGGKES